MQTQSRAATRDAFLRRIGEKPAIMGILNVTPDSFADGGKYSTTEAALAQAEAMVRDGCAIVDIGGESTRPGATPISAQDELARVAPIVAEVHERCHVPISIDTYKAAVALEAAKLGAVVINDVWGLRRDPLMAHVVAETECAVVIMHNRERADTAIDIVDDICRTFDDALNRAAEAGVPAEHVILDPGVGFGKSFDQNLECINKVDVFRKFGRPLLLGLSRKSFIGRILDNDVQDRLIGTLAANLVGLMRGVSVIRVHDVAAHQQAIAILEAIKGL